MTRPTEPPKAAPPVVSRAEYDAARAKLLLREKEVTHLNDQVSSERRHLPMVEMENYRFTSADGALDLVDLFDGHYLLLVQNVMFAPDWDDVCPHCSWATDQLPARMSRLTDEGIALAMISEAPADKLQRVAQERGWPHRWVSSGETSYARDWGWWMDGEEYSGPVPGFSYYLLHDGVPYLTYATTQRGVEAHLPILAMRNRTCYWRQEEWEVSPAGWPQYPVGS